MITVIDANTGEILEEGTWEEVRECVNTHKYIRKERMYELFGWVDETENTIYVVD